MAYSDNDGEVSQPRIKTPASGPRPGKGKMPKTELQTLVSGLIDSSRQFLDLELTPDRAKATRYYKGEPFGNEQKGRSAFVMTEVHDGVQAVLPSMLRVIFGPEHAVEIAPKSAKTSEAAAQATDYIRYIVEECNRGFERLESVAKDGLIRRHGIVKWGWEDYGEIKQHRVEKVTMDDLALLVEDGWKPTLVEQNPDGTLNAELTATATKRDGKAWFCEVPPEEFLAVRETRYLDDTIFVAHQSRKTTGELLQMGIKSKQIEKHGGDDPQLRDDEMALERHPDQSNDEADAGEANEKHLYIECYARIDYDGDGIAELRNICTLGPSHEVVHNEPVDEVPFAVWTPDREPHALMGGRSWADRLMDMQRLKSQLMRSMLDSASASIFPRKWYKEGDANLQDLLSTNLGAPIRTRSGPNAVGEFAHSFMGKDLLGVIELTNDIVERRTGINKGTAGLDADALQSSTRAAVAAAVTASQAQQEMLVRGFAEQLLKPLFRGLYRLYVKHKPMKTTVKLRGKWVDVDPAYWDAELDVSVNVALGSGLAEEKVQTLFDIVTKQEQILQQMGPQNPIVNLKQYRDTMAEMLALRGKKDASKYFLEITDQQIQQMAEAAKNAPPPPSPEMELAKAQIQIEQTKAQAKIAADQAKAQVSAQLESHKAQLEAQIRQIESQHKIQIEEIKMQIERERMQLEDDRERDKQAADIALKVTEMEVTAGVDLNEQAITAQIERERMSSQAEGESAKIASGERVAGEKIKSSERVAKAKEKVQAARQAVKAPKAEEKPKSRKRTVRVKRGGDGRAESYEIEDSE